MKRYIVCCNDGMMLDCPTKGSAEIEKERLRKEEALRIIKEMGEREAERILHGQFWHIHEVEAI